MQDMHSTENWYASQQGMEFLDSTRKGEMAFVWQAVYEDGTVYQQFEEKIMQRALTDAAFLPGDFGRSVASLDVRQVVVFRLLPTAIALSKNPRLQSILVRVQLELDEKYIYYRLVDDWITVDPVTQQVLRKGKLVRHVIGIGQRINGAAIKVLYVISPSGSVVVSTTDDISFEGE